MTAPRFNVIVMMLDDVYWEDFDRMQRLRTRVLPDGANGKWVRFDRTYVQYALCGPSRFTAMSGRYARHLGVHSHFKAYSDPVTTAVMGGTWPTDARSVAAGEIRLRDHLLAQRLAEVGYTCGLMGKYNNKEPWLLGDTYQPPGWTRWNMFLDDHEITDEAEGPQIQNPNHNSHKGSQYQNYDRNDNGVIKHNGLESAGTPWTSTGTTTTGRAPGIPPVGPNTNYATDKFSKDSREWLATVAEPFFFWWGHRAAHNESDPTGAIPAIRHNGITASVFPDENGAFPAWPTGSAADPAGFNEADISDKPTWFKATYAAQLTNPEITLMRLWQTQAWRALQAVDEAIYDLFLQLNQQDSTRGGKLVDNTVVIVTNDNGFTRGQNRAQKKTTSYEPSIRTNMWIHWPTMPQPADGGPGQHTDHALVSLVDLAPTIMEIAGVKPTRAFDGMSLIPRIIDPSFPWRRDLRGEYNATTGDAADVPQHSWCIGWAAANETPPLYKYALIPPSNVASYNGPGTWLLPEDELYDLTTDTGELVNQTTNLTEPWPTIKTDFSQRRSRLHSF